MTALEYGSSLVVELRIGSVRDQNGRRWMQAKTQDGEHSSISGAVIIPATYIPGLDFYAALPERNILQLHNQLLTAAQITPYATYLPPVVPNALFLFPGLPMVHKEQVIRERWAVQQQQGILLTVIDQDYNTIRALEDQLLSVSGTAAEAIQEELLHHPPRIYDRQELGSFHIGQPSEPGDLLLRLTLVTPKTASESQIGAECQIHEIQRYESGGVALKLDYSRQEGRDDQFTVSAELTPERVMQMLGATQRIAEPESRIIQRLQGEYDDLAARKDQSLSDKARLDAIAGKMDELQAPRRKRDIDDYMLLYGSASELYGAALTAMRCALGSEPDQWSVGFRDVALAKSASAGSARPLNQ